MSDLTIRHEGVAVQPVTGEALVLADEPTDVLARHIKDLRNFTRDQIRDFTTALETEILRRMDFDARYSLAANDLVIRGDGPGLVEYNAEQLYGELSDLVAEGHISQAAMDSAVQQVTAFKAKAAGCKALKKQGGLVAQVVEDCETPKPYRRVTVKDAA